MGTKIHLIRFRAGFYVTRDGQWRIHRIRPRIGGPLMWSVETWSADEHKWIWIVRTFTLRTARARLVELIRLVEERE